MTPPKIDGAPGLKWFPRKTGWEARWRARLDLVRKGYKTKSVPLWKGATLDEVPSEQSAAYIVGQCERLQGEMLVWGRGGISAPAPKFDGTLKSLIGCYLSDPDSPYIKKLAFATRRNCDALCKRLVLEHGDQRLGDTIVEGGKTIEGIKARGLMRWHEQWEEGGRISSAHAMIAMLRTLMTFGKILLEDKEGSAECARIKDVLGEMRFKTSKPRKQKITADQAIAVRAKAHELKMPSIARAQAFQFECTLRQKDVIGEWLPISEPGMSLIAAGNDKWMVGLTWQQIDEDLILRHTTNKRKKDIEVDLKLAPMVLEELEFAYPGFAVENPVTKRLLINREMLPASGALIVYETTGMPYYAYQFRREWRIVARVAGVPAAVFNMDSRAGAISEALIAGAPIGHVKHAATHSNITTTEGYDRTAIEATAEVMRTRVEHRNKK